MAVQTQSVVPAVEWDDSIVVVFSWNNRQFFAGFVHLQIATATATGTTTQLNNITQQVVQNQIQASSDPQNWLDTVKNSVRVGKSINITFDDAISVVYTTQTNQSFTLQELFSIAG
jgi:predicted amidophosphoribosyltransferase